MKTFLIANLEDTEKFIINVEDQHNSKTLDNK
jgi:hypothetical protein